MRYTIAPLLFCGVLQLLLSGCSIGGFWGDTPAETAAAQTIESLGDAARFTVIMEDNFFGYSDSNMVSPPVWTLPQGKRAIFTFDNQGTLEHNWVVVKPGATVPIPFDENRASDILLYDLGKVPGDGCYLCDVYYPRSRHISSDLHCIGTLSIYAGSIGCYRTPTM